MSQIQEIKRRIKSVTNIGHVTHAMELVAASRMRKAQENAQRSRAYAEKIREILLRITNKQRLDLHPMLDLTPAAKAAMKNVALVVVFSPQRGLAGALPGNLLRSTLASLKKFKDSGTDEIRIVSIGKKLRRSLMRLDYKVIADFSDMPEYPTTGDIRPIVTMIRESYIAREINRVLFMYPKFVNAVTQQAISRVLLPLDVSELAVYGEKVSNLTIGKESTSSEFIFEPRRREIIDNLILNYLQSQIYQARLETVASEYSARMVAMKNATDNAEEVKDELTLEYNKSRQSQITLELAEISAGGLS